MISWLAGLPDIVKTVGFVAAIFMAGVGAKGYIDAPYELAETISKVDSNSAVRDSVHLTLPMHFGARAGLAIVNDRLDTLALNQMELKRLVYTQLCLELADREQTNWRACLTN